MGMIGEFKANGFGVFIDLEQGLERAETAAPPEVISQHVHTNGRYPNAGRRTIILEGRHTETRELRAIGDQQNCGHQDERR